jgi:acetylornithine deacetylase/succinyl-diaminopimelate desuccinylase-like protein
MEALLASEEVNPAAVIIGESTKGDITTGHRGRGEVEIVASGMAGHASAPERARNALDLLPDLLAAVQDLASTQGEDEVLGRASVVATDVRCFPESPNVIPDQATVVLDWRVLPGHTNEELLEEVRRAIAGRIPEVPEGWSIEIRMATEKQTTHTGVTEVRDLFTPGFLMREDDPLVLAAANAVGRKDGQGAADVRPWTFATDGGWSAGVFGIPTLGFAPGEERFAHTNRERLDLQEARWAYSRYPDLILAVQQVLAGGG